MNRLKELRAKLWWGGKLRKRDEIGRRRWKLNELIDTVAMGDHQDKGVSRLLLLSFSY